MLKQSFSLGICFAVVLLGSSHGAIQATSKPLAQWRAVKTEMRVPLASFVASTKAHTVSRGETLWGISRKYKVDYKTLAKLNGLAAENPVIQVGQALRLPAAPKKTAKAPAKKAPKKLTGYGLHQVHKGDTFFQVARRNGVSVSALREANKGVDPAKLKLGQSLKIPQYGKVAAAPPVKKAPAAVKSPKKETTLPKKSTKPKVAPPQDRAKKAPEGYGIYTVQRGDSTQSIAKQYGITREEFLRINQKSSFPNYDPRPGEFLMVPTDGSWYVPPTSQVRTGGAPTNRAAVAPPANPLRGTGRAAPTTPRKRMLVLHRVETNDSLEDLAKRFRTTTDQIRLDNPGIQKNSDLVVGLDLKIRTASPL